MSVCSLLLGAVDQILEPKTIESLRVMSIHPVIYAPLLAIILSVVLGYLLASWLRLKDYGWKFSLILAAWSVSIAIVVFGTFKLGADLRGGVNLVYEVNEEETALLNPAARGAYDLNGVVDVLRQRINPSGVKDLVIRKSGPRQIEIVVSEVDQAQIDDIKRRVTSTGTLQFMIVANDETKDGHIIDAAREQERDPQRKMSREVKDSEGKLIGLWTKLARVDGDKPDSAYRYPLAYRDLIRDRQTGDIVNLTPAEQSEISAALQTNDDEVFTRVLADRGIREVEVLLRTPDNEHLDVRGEDLAHASPSFGTSSTNWEVNFVMKPQGVGKMGALTGQNLGPPKRSLAIVFDNELISAPTIEDQITDNGVIRGDFSEQEVRFMSELLKSGSMPVVMYPTPIAENLIDAILGWDTIKKGSMSLAVSLLVVLALVALYYRFAGITAAAALVLNLLLTVAIMIVIQAPFTLPGLAGLVLTVGMSIDANVLIFERIREEAARGAALRMQIRNGFDKALSAILDGNLTTFLTAFVLYVIGTDQLRGFGITLMLGNVISMFTAIFCARVIFDAGERTRLLKSLSMTQFLTSPKIDWVRLFPPATIASGVLILLGLIAAVSRGAGIFDIDLKGGSSVTPMLKAQMKDDEVRTAMREQLAGLRDEKTGASIDFQVYEVSIEGEQPDTVYKIDSSLERVDDLERHVHEALKDPKTGEKLLRTYQMEYAIVSSGPIEAPSEEPPVEGAGGAAPPPSEAKTPETKSAPETKTVPETKSAPETKSGKQGDDAAKESPGEKAGESPADCGQEEDSKSDAATKEKGAAKSVKTDEKAAGEKAGETTADDPTKSDPDEAAPATVPSTAPEAAAPTVTAPPDGESTPPAAAEQTTAEIRFPDNRISAYALLEHIRQSAAKTLGHEPFTKVSNPNWVPGDNTPYETWTAEIHIGRDNAKKLLDDLQTKMSGSPVWQNTSSVSGQVTLDMQLRALSAILVSLLGIAAYIWVRFQRLSWGIAAIASLVHDTLVMIAGIGASYYLASALGFLGIDEFKISLTVVAGFLTLIGYSINDTIVIFDRIREMRGKSPYISAQLINDAVNQTLSRTILTGGLTLIVVLILYIFGGEGIHTFAFCMLIGVLSGTYSTVFIAAPLLLWLMKTAPSSASAASKPAAAKQPVTTGGRT